MSTDFKLHGKAAAKSVRATRPRSSALTLVTVDPKVMDTAKRLAEGDLARLRIVDAQTVVVENH